LHKITQVKDFLIYNRAWAGTREYRIKFADLLLEYNLLDCCQTKFQAIDSGLHYREHNFKNLAFKPIRQDIENFFQPNTAQPWYSADYNSQDYQTTNIEVVLETLFDDTRWHLTEKTLKPIVCAQPFILVSTPGVLKYLRSYGFETFAPWIDESYDDETDGIQRLHLIMQEMQRISRLSEPHKSQMLRACKQIAEQNQKLFFSRQFHDQIVGELKTNLEIGRQELEESCRATFLRNLRKLNFPHNSRANNHNNAAYERRLKFIKEVYLKMHRKNRAK
jgi:hypothetical protein